MIPKVIHYCWFGGGEIPRKYQDYIDGWQKICPDYKIVRWDENNYDIHKNSYMEQAYVNKKWSFVSDYARFDIIYQQGGIYLDTDVELKKNLDEVLDSSAFMALEKNESGVSVAAGLGFGAEPKNPVIKDLRDAYENIDFIKENGSLNVVPIPIYTTNYLQKRGLIREDIFQEVAGIKIYPTEYFAPLDFLTGLSNETEKTIGIHHYSALWQDERSQKHTEIIRTLNRRLGKGLGMKVNWILRVYWGLSRRIRERSK